MSTPLLIITILVIVLLVFCPGVLLTIIGILVGIWVIAMVLIFNGVWRN